MLPCISMFLYIKKKKQKNADIGAKPSYTNTTKPLSKLSHYQNINKSNLTKGHSN